MKDYEISEIMISPAVTVCIKAPFHIVEEKFRTQGIRHLPVVDDEGRMVGLVTQRDMYRTVAPHITPSGLRYDPETLDEFLLEVVMKKEVATLTPKDRFSKAVGIMSQRKYGCIPIVDPDRRVLGILTETDVLRLVADYYGES